MTECKCIGFSLGKVNGSMERNRRDPFQRQDGFEATSTKVVRGKGYSMTQGPCRIRISEYG